MFYPDSKTNLTDHQYKLGYDVCKTGEAASEASSCLAGVQTLRINASHFVNESVSDQHLPPVCSLTRLANGTVVHFNNGHKGNCSSSSKRSGDGSSKVGVKVKIELDSSGMFKMLLAGQYCSQIRASKMATFEMKSLTLQAAQEARDQWMLGLQCRLLRLANGMPSLHAEQLTVESWTGRRYQPEAT